LFRSGYAGGRTRPHRFRLERLRRPGRPAGLPDVPPELPVLPPERLMILVDPPEAPPGAPELPAMELPAVLEPPDGPPACDTVAPEHPIMVAVAADNRRMTRERCAVIGASDRSQDWITAYPISIRFSVSEPLLPSDFLTGETPAQVPPRVGRRIRGPVRIPRGTQKPRLFALRGLDREADGVTPACGAEVVARQHVTPPP